jgi:hypothetical protein
MLIDNFSGDFSTVDERGTHRDIVAGTGCEDFLKGYSVTNLGVDFLNVDFVTLFHAVLFSAGFEDCVGHRLFPWVGGPGTFHRSPPSASVFLK